MSLLNLNTLQVLKKKEREGTNKRFLIDSMEIPLTTGDEYYPKHSIMQVSARPEDPEKWKAYPNKELQSKVKLSH